MKTMTRERPILFKPEMVRAILAGAKTQTRRPVKLDPSGYIVEPRGKRRWHRDDPEAVAGCPYGAPGDRLWVREAWSVYAAEGASLGAPCGDVWVPTTRAELPRIRDLDPTDTRICYRADDLDGGMVCYSAMFMPRWASRITLEIVSVRVERVNEIAEEDALAEGFEPVESISGSMRAITAFGRAWDSLYTKTPFCWSKSPWVWVVEFKRVAETPAP